ncbi:MAG: MMPL family transporter [Candidatus Methanomethylophilaceae archaeon]|nr:MMPL family transporter [Candidatus Methanomethylophilaceae archaeon]
MWEASYVTGTAATLNDISKEVESEFSMIRIVVAVLLIVLLFVILGSYLTPIRAILTIMFSVILSVSLTSLVFVNLMDTPVLFLVPIVLFVVLLGLGMDYEIFLTTKIRENRSKGMDDHDAISQAIREAGPVIMLCALLMGGTFLTLTLAGSSMLQEFGFALGVGILIDGLLMVGFVSPAIMHLMGDWSWKGPGFLTRRHGMNPDGSLIQKEE